MASFRGSMEKKVLNAEYSQKRGRREMFEAQRRR